MGGRGGASHSLASESWLGRVACLCCCDCRTLICMLCLNGSSKLNAEAMPLTVGVHNSRALVIISTRIDRTPRYSFSEADVV